MRLQQRGLSLIQLHLYRQLVGTGSHTSGKHLVHVLVQCTQRLGVTIGQFQLVGDGNNLPIRLFSSGQCFLLLHVQLRLGQTSQVLGNLVISHNLATSKDRLLHRNDTRNHILGVDLESVRNLFTNLVQRPFHVEAHQVGDQLVQGRVMLQKCPRNHGHGVVIVNSQHLLAIGINFALRRCPYAVERSHILIAQQLEVSAIVHISARCRHFGQVIGVGGIHFVTSLVDLLLGHFQFLVVLEGEPSALVQSEHPLRRHRQRNRTKRDHQYTVFQYFIHFLFLFVRCCKERAYFSTKRNNIFIKKYLKVEIFIFFDQ